MEKGRHSADLSWCQGGDKQSTLAEIPMSPLTRGKEEAVSVAPRKEASRFGSTLGVGALHFPKVFGMQ